VSTATHIVGGEFQVSWSGTDVMYNVSMNMYYDDLHAAAGLFGEDLEIYPSIYRIVDDAFMGIVKLSRISTDFIPIGVEGCADLSLISTRLFKYNGVINLDGYTSPQGYYIVWERCCRNDQITNIDDPEKTGEVFYLQFAPVNLRNATPYFKPLTNQYWCVGVTHYLDYSGFDANGDELRYELSTPLAGSSTFGNVSPNFPTVDRTLQAPYDPVVWSSGYDVGNQITGSIPLSINATTGLVTFNAGATGLYVFGVKVSEYRAGVKIGEAVRDFQLLVQNCPVNFPPKIGLDKTFNNGVGQVEMFINEVKSIDLFFADATTTSQFLSDNITFVSVSSSLPLKAFQISGAAMLFPGRDTVKTQLIINPCNYVKINTETTLRVQIIVRDNRCPPMYDTLLFDLKLKIPDNDPPAIEVIPTGKLDNTMYPGDALQFTVEGTDADVLDKLTLTGQGNGFNLGDLQMYFNNVSDSSVTISSPFYWSPTCEVVNQGPFMIRFTVKDNSCIYSNASFIDVKVNVIDKVSTVDQYRPVNLITANSDGLNDSFYLYNAPDENCATYFKSVSIYNSWGSCVFYNTSRDFVWKPTSPTMDGIYYYTFDFNEHSINGWIHVIASE